MRRRIFLRCFSKHAFESVGARVWASLAQHSGCPKLQASRCLRCKAAHAPQNKPNWDCQHCCSKHALQNMPGWPLGFSGRSEQRSETYFRNSYHAGASDPLPNMSCKTSRADRSPSPVWATRWHSLEQRSSWLQTCPSKHAGLTAIGFSGRSEQRSDTRLSNALADQSSCTVPVDIPLPAVRF